MQLALNLCDSQSPRQRYLLFWAVPVGLLAFLLLVRMIVSLPTDWKEHRAAREATLQEQRQGQQLRDRAASFERALEGPEYREPLRQVRFVNGLIAEKELSLTELTAKIAALLPPQVRLTALQLPDASGNPLVRLAIEAASEEQTEDFLINLEDSPDFREVTVMNEGFEQKGANAAPVTISCTARYVGGRARKS